MGPHFYLQEQFPIERQREIASKTARLPCSEVHQNFVRYLAALAGRRLIVWGTRLEQLERRKEVVLS